MLLTFLPTGSLVAAQGEGGKTPAKVTHVADAAVTTAERGLQLEFSVRGLTEEKVAAVQKSLMALKTEVYTCSGCKHEQAAKGHCSMCDVDLKGVEKAVLFEAVPSVEKSTIRVTPLAARSLRYSDLARVLGKNSIQIDGARFPIAGEALLVVRGGTLADSKAVEKSLRDSKLFVTVAASFDEASSEIHVMVDAGKKSPMWDQVTPVIADAGKKLEMSDVVWETPVPPTGV